MEQRKLLAGQLFKCMISVSDLYSTKGKGKKHKIYLLLFFVFVSIYPLWNMFDVLLSNCSDSFETFAAVYPSKRSYLFKATME